MACFVTYHLRFQPCFVNAISHQTYIDPQNVAHYSDMIGTIRRAIKQITTNAEDDQLLQVFQQTLVDISFMLGVQLGRWIPFQLFKWDADRYVAIANIPPRDKDR